MGVYCTFDAKRRTYEFEEWDLDYYQHTYDIFPDTNGVYHTCDYYNYSYLLIECDRRLFFRLAEAFIVSLLLKQQASYPDVKNWNADYMEDVIRCLESVVPNVDKSLQQSVLIDHQSYVDDFSLLSDFARNEVEHHELNGYFDELDNHLSTELMYIIVNEMQNFRNSACVTRFISRIYQWSNIEASKRVQALDFQKWLGLLEHVNDRYPMRGKMSRIVKKLMQWNPRQSIDLRTMKLAFDDVIWQFRGRLSIDHQDAARMQQLRSVSSDMLLARHLRKRFEKGLIDEAMIREWLSYDEAAPLNGYRWYADGPVSNLGSSAYADDLELHQWIIQVISKKG